MKIKRKILLPCMVAALPWVPGCAASNFNSTLPQTFAIRQGQTIEFVPIENVTGNILDPPADQIFNEYMVGLLKERNLLNVAPAPAAQVLKSKLIEYEPGNAFKRWLLPGYGSSVCAVHAELFDKATTALIGRIESRQTVSVGGGYSIGADTYICKRAADELVGEIEKRVAK